MDMNIGRYLSTYEFIVIIVSVIVNQQGPTC